MKVKRQLRMLLSRIDGELAEVRDGLIEVDHRAGRAAYATAEVERRVAAIESAVIEIQRHLTTQAADGFSRKV